MSKINYILFLALFLIGTYYSDTIYGQSMNTKMVTIKGGTFVPLYGKVDSPIKIKDFKLDIFPVTNQQFQTFLNQNPKWKKDKIIALYADKTYLQQFDNQSHLIDKNRLQMPVITVSWFVAKAYCECQGKRLPTTDEWEYVAAADQTAKDARKKDDYNNFILSWYSKPNSYNQKIGSTFKNAWGVWDMHGLVWEWTSDFNSVLISNDSRAGSAEDNQFFCGGASINANDLTNYAAFMRYAFRGSLKAKYSVRNLGFRCAQTIK